ncbi:MAG: UvrD-helicase domain-containing protein [Planctomycetota bacterium]|nr:UvrD-helicase domain-containing protein [Planctomycetota bacterium]
MSATATTTRPGLTAEQQQAIFTRDVSVALSAGAGCGKTFVLTERFLSHLEPDDSGEAPKELHELIAITFTERAAREMRDRIRIKCFERLQSAPAEQADYWLQLLRSLDAARVSTIHAFCGTLLRQNAVEASLDPRFGVLEPAQGQTLIHELIDDMLRSRLSTQDQPIMDLIVLFGLDWLRTLLAGLLEQIRGHVYAPWLTMTVEQQLDRWQAFHRQTIVPDLLRRLSESPSAQSILKVLKSTIPEHPVMAERRARLLELLPTLPQAADPAAVLTAIRENAKVQGGGSEKHWPDASDYQTFKAAATKLRDQISATLKLLTFDRASATASAQVGLTLLKVVDEIAVQYTRAKHEASLLDFNDLLIEARRLLTDPQHVDLRNRLAASTRLLLVDECQDTDPVQIELIEALCGGDALGGKLFFVGDSKQSIYRFRGADPKVFRQLRQQTPERGRLPLTKNFRSCPAILTFVNALFCDDCGPDYEPLVPHRPDGSNSPAIEFLWSIEDPAADTSIKKPSVSEMRAREADWIARRLRMILDGESIDGEPPLTVQERNGIARPVRPGDIAILFRALSDVACYEEALRSAGIDYYLVGGHAFYAQQEIFDLLNLLRSLASRADEVSLAGVLRSPFFSLTDETLFWLSRSPGGLGAGLFASQLSDDIESEQRKRVKFAAQTLRELRENKDRLPIAGLINLALTRTGYDAALLSEFLGERKLANLRKLLQQARTFDRSGNMGLNDFIVQLSEFVISQPREALAATNPESTDVVRLMTVHQSKGLEFPVVVVPDLGRKNVNTADPVAYQPDLGPLVRLSKDADEAQGVNGHQMYTSMQVEEEQQELIRLFYVATTRAADYLILSSSIADLDKPTGPWLHFLAKRFSLDDGQSLAKLPEGYQSPAVRVIKERPTPSAAAVPRHSQRDLRRMIAKVENGTGDVPLHVAKLAEPVAANPQARRRFSVSRLSGMLETATEALVEDDGEDQSIASKAEASARTKSSGQVDPIRLGIVIHEMLATIDLKNLSEIALRLRRCCEKHGANTAEQALAEELVQRFVKSSRAEQMRQAKQKFTELEFMLAWPDQAGHPAGRYLQGYLDCLYQDSQGGWHVLDYKSNLVTPENEAELARHYELQMLVYALAAEQALSIAPQSVVLHFLRSGTEHVYPWDTVEKERLTAIVEKAMQGVVTTSS